MDINSSEHCLDTPAGSQRPNDGLAEHTLELPADSMIGGVVHLRVEPDHAALGTALPAGSSLVIGSAPGADIRVHDATVSARHCRVTHLGRGIEVTDLGARNGVRVLGARVSSVSLPVGGWFEIGRVLVRIDPAQSPSDRVAQPLPGLVGASPAMRALAAAVRRVAPLRLPVLLRGESGAGKELVARAICEESRRRDRAFVAINACAISRELAESELFGHQRGAFTGASRERRGAFREADGGTLFLDEIGAVPPEVQAKLLRVVEEGVVRPVGAEGGTPIDVRLVAATCEPLETMVSSHRFRRDLYERLAVCVVHVPSLRERRDDIPALARHLLAASDLAGRKLTGDALAALRAHNWPGNVRELRNVLVQAALQADEDIRAEHIASVLASRAGRASRMIPADALRFFDESGGNISAAARRAGLPRSTMRDLLRSVGIVPLPSSGKQHAQSVGAARPPPP